MHIRDRAIIGFLSLTLAILTGVLVVPSFAPGPPNTTPNTTSSVPRPYIEGIVGSAATVSPFSAQTVAEREISTLLFRGLVRLGPDDTLIGDLAESWTVDPTGAAWTFRLRHGLTWQDGVPITARDVLFTVSALSDPSYTGPGASSWREVRATSSDPYTVTLTLATPLGGFLEAATQGIAPAHLLAGVAPAALPTDPFGRTPVGSGAFRLVSLDLSHAVLRPFLAEPGASQPSAAALSSQPPTDALAAPAPTSQNRTPVPYLAGIEFRFYPGVDEMTSAWGLGQIDAAIGMPADAATRLVTGGGAHLLRYPSTTLFSVTLNLRPTHPEFQSPAVRKALLQAINRDAIVRDVLGGMAVRADGLVPPSSWAFDPASNAVVAYDPAAAQAALLAAGWTRASGGTWVPKGWSTPLAIELLSPQAGANASAYAVADAVAAAWRAIGLDVSHSALAGTELVRKHLQTGEFTAAVTGTIIGLDPDFYPLLASTQARPSGSNFSGLQDPALDLLLVKARGPGTDEARRAAYAALQVKLAAGMYTLALAFPDVVVVVRDTVSGPTPRPVGSPGDRFWDVLTWRLAEGR